MRRKNFMERSDSGRIPLRVIAIQVAILAGLLIFLKFYLPHQEKAQADAALEARDSRIEAFFHTVTGEGEGGGQTLRSTPTVLEVDEAVGAPDTSSTDYAGGLHLTWNGTNYSLVGSFYHGSLYALSLTDTRTGQTETANK
jgi:hypothetical protein